VGQGGQIRGHQSGLIAIYRALTTIMKLPTRRQFLHLAAGAAALPAISRIARAQSYPTRPVRIVVGFSAGGTQDIAARIIGQWLSERRGQQFIIDNRPGAAGNIAAEAVVHAPADGYTLLLVGLSNAANASLYEHLNFNFVREVIPVAGIIRVPLILEVHPSFPAKNVPEFIAYAKANPGKVNMASAGIGFKMMAGVDVLQVQYRGSGPALIDVLGGQVQGMIDPLPSSIEYVRSGKLRPLAVTTEMRSNALPDTPSVAEFVPGFQSSSWYGVGAPRGTPAQIVEQLNVDINAALSDPTLKARLAKLGGMLLPGIPADFGKLIADETEKWAKVAKFAGIKAE
jgi:tripartite-type tricarboxylate transporter receptor subunit TctC